MAFRPGESAGGGAGRGGDGDRPQLLELGLDVQGAFRLHGADDLLAGILLGELELDLLFLVDGGRGGFGRLDEIAAAALPAGAPSGG